MLTAVRSAKWTISQNVMTDFTGALQTLAIAVQSRVSEVMQVDIHPAAQIGMGIMIDHATGVVIGETAIVGDNVSLLHHVTLGGSGTGKGTRHPSIGMHPGPNVHSMEVIFGKPVDRVQCMQAMECCWVLGSACWAPFLLGQGAKSGLGLLL